MVIKYATRHQFLQIPLFRPQGDEGRQEVARRRQERLLRRVRQGRILIRDLRVRSGTRQRQARCVRYQLQGPKVRHEERIQVWGDSFFFSPLRPISIEIWYSRERGFVIEWFAVRCVVWMRTYSLLCMGKMTGESDCKRFI